MVHATVKLRNFNMNTEFKRDDGAWGRNHKIYEERWLHSDMQDMSFFHNHKLFEKTVEIGELK